MNHTDATRPARSAGRLGRSAAWALLAGAWAALCLSLPQLGYALLDEPMRAHAFDLVSTPGLALSKRWSLSALPPWLLQALIAFVVVSLATSVWLWGLRRLDMDGSAQRARRALRWSLRSFPMLLLWLSGLAITLGLMALAVQYAGPYFPWAAGLALLYCLSWPFFFLRREVIACGRPPLAWLPSWPGWPAIGVAALGMLVWWSLALALDALESDHLAVGAIASLVFWLAQLTVLSAVLLVWLRRSRSERLLADLRDAWLTVRLRRLFAVQWLLYGLLALTIAPLVLVASVDAIFIHPGIRFAFEEQRLAPPSALTYWFEMSERLLEWWWVGSAILTVWLDPTSSAHVLIEMETVPEP